MQNGLCRFPSISICILYPHREKGKQKRKQYVGVVHDTGVQRNILPAQYIDGDKNISA